MSFYAPMGVRQFILSLVGANWSLALFASRLFLSLESRCQRLFLSCSRPFALTSYHPVPRTSSILFRRPGSLRTNDRIRESPRVQDGSATTTYEMAPARTSAPHVVVYSVVVEPSRLSSRVLGVFCSSCPLILLSFGNTFFSPHFLVLLAGSLLIFFALLLTEL